MTQMSVLFVDDEEHLRIAADQTFELADINCTCVSNADDALTDLDHNFPGVLVTDIRMPGTDGLALMQKTLEIDPELPIILLTGHGDVELAVTCLKNGAYDFLEKPCQPAKMIATVQRALDHRRLTLEIRSLKDQLKSSNIVESRLIGRSEPMVALRKRIGAVATTDADILITGDTGTGKEIAARAIHRISERSSKPFVHVNCAALPEALMESELFGSEAGAFPGSTRARVGKLEHARGGTLCLDEIDSLPTPLQAKLLDVLHNRCVTRLGSNDAIPLDIRVIAVSKINLEHAAAQERFRPDLLYRLNVITIDMPKLSDRREDIPGLFTVLLGQAAHRYGVPLPTVSAAVLNELSAQDWPGNVRELRNEAERIVLGLADNADAGGPTHSTLAEHMAKHEKALISAAITANGGRLKETYESLGLSRKTLYEKMQKHQLVRDDFSENG